MSEHLENSEGYLVDHQTWTREWAIQKAQGQNLILEDFDWQVIEFARGFYAEHGIIPLTRRIIKFIRENIHPDFDSIALQNRYSEKPLRIIALIAGLPRPIQCI